MWGPRLSRRRGVRARRAESGSCGCAQSIGLERRVHQRVGRRRHAELAAEFDHLAAEPRQLDVVAAIEAFMVAGAFLLKASARSSASAGRLTPRARPTAITSL